MRHDDVYIGRMQIFGGLSSVLQSVRTIVAQEVFATVLQCGNGDIFVCPTTFILFSPLLNGVNTGRSNDVQNV